MKSTNPATGKELKERLYTDLKSARACANRVRARQSEWKMTSFERRAQILLQVATTLREQSESLAILMAEEMGKPISEGQSEILKCAKVCEYYAEKAESFLTDELISTEASKSYVAFEPLGTVLAVMPWNFPFWQVFRFVAPALMAGNTVVLKHASNVQGCAEAIESILNTTGEKDLLVNVFLSNEDTEALVEHESIAAATLTGSTGAGRAIGARCGKALKKAVLELGGSDPYLVLADADIVRAAECCVNSRLINNGQSCIAAKRFIVSTSVRAEFEQQVVALMQNKKVGDPLNAETELGPMAREDLRDELHKQVMDSVDKGASLLLGGEVPTKAGAWYPPTILTNVSQGMPAYAEEVFGPVACIIEAKDEDDAIRIANDSPFGLGSAIFSSDVKRAEQLSSRIEAGACFINDFVRSDPRLPFGGVKQSGYGRELEAFGIREFVNIKTICIA